MSHEPTQAAMHAVVYRQGCRLVLGPPCTTLDCAEASVSVLEGATVLGFVSGTFTPLPEPMAGMQFALQRDQRDTTCR